MRRYRNEGMVLVALLILLGAWGYRHYAQAQLEQARETVARDLREIKESMAMRRLWGDAQIPKKLQALRGALPGSALKEFTLSKRKLELKLQGLAGRDLNKAMSRLASLPVRIEKLSIVRSADRYALECTCKW